MLCLLTVIPTPVSYFSPFLRYRSNTDACFHKSSCFFSLASSFSRCRYYISSFYASCCFLSYFFIAISWHFSSFSATSCNHFYIFSCNGVYILETNITLNRKEWFGTEKEKFLNILLNEIYYFFCPGYVNVCLMGIWMCT